MIILLTLTADKYWVFTINQAIYEAFKNITLFNLYYDSTVLLLLVLPPYRQGNWGLKFI